MSMKRFLVAASASLAGLMVLVCAWSSASAAGQVVYFCELNPTNVAAHSSTVVTCSSSTLQGFMTDFNTAYVNADASADSPDITINSIEVTLNGLQAGSILLDYMDIAFTPYVDTVGGGGIPGNNTTYGGFNSPNLDLCKTAANTWLKTSPFSGTPPFSYQYELQIFVSNSDSTVHHVSGTLHVITNFDQGLCT
jgi:hypothetical protein